MPGWAPIGIPDVAGIHMTPRWRQRGVAISQRDPQESCHRRAASINLAVALLEKIAEDADTYARVSGPRLQPLAGLLK
jgi:hypothetical protein